MQIYSYVTLKQFIMQYVYIVLIVGKVVFIDLLHIVMILICFWISDNI